MLKKHKGDWTLYNTTFGENNEHEAAFNLSEFDYAKVDQDFLDHESVFSYLSAVLNDNLRHSSNFEEFMTKVKHDFRLTKYGFEHRWMKIHRDSVDSDFFRDDNSPENRAFNDKSADWLDGYTVGYSDAVDICRQRIRENVKP